jgi:hypothetical protein
MFKMMVHETIVDPTSSTLLKYVRDSGLGIEVGHNMASTGSITVYNKSLPKVIVDAQNMFKRGLFATNSELSAEDVSSEQLRRMRNGEVLRLMNNLTLKTPYLGNDISNIFMRSAPVIGSEDYILTAKRVLSIYLVQYLKGIIKSSPPDQKILSIAIRPSINLLLDGLPSTTLLEVGPAELFYYMRDKDSGSHDSLYEANYALFHKRITQYIEFLSQIGDMINESTDNLDFFSGDSDTNDMSSWIAKTKDKLKMSADEDFVRIKNTPVVRQPRISFEIDRREKIDQGFVEELEIVESSHDIIFLVNLVAIHKASADRNKRNIKEKFPTTADPIPTKVQIRSIPRFTFFVNYAHKMLSIGEAKSVFDSPLLDFNDEYDATYTALKRGSDKQMRAHSDKLKEVHAAILNTAVSMLDGVSVFTTARENEESSYWAKRENKLLFGETGERMYNQLREFSLFSDRDNDPSSIENLCYYKLTNVYAKSNMFFVKNIPCIYKALFFYVMFTTYGTFDEGRDWAKSDVEDLYSRVTDIIASRYRSDFLKLCQSEYERGIHRGRQVRLYRKSFLTLEQVGKTQISDITKMIEDDYENIRGVSNCLMSDQLLNNELVTEINNTQYFTDFKNVSTVATLSSPYDDGVINSQITSSSDELLINPDQLMMNCLRASQTIRRAPDSNLEAARIRSEYLTKNLVLDIEIPLLLSSCISSDIGEFFTTLGNYVKMMREVERAGFREGIVYISETKTWFALNPNTNTYKKISWFELMNIYQIDKEQHVAPFVIGGYSALRITPVVFLIKNNHVSLLSYSDSNRFLTLAYNRSKKRGNTTYSITSDTTPMQYLKKYTSNMTFFNELRKAETDKRQHKFDPVDIRDSPKMFGVWDIESAAEPVTGKQIPYVIILKIFSSKNFILTSKVNEAQFTYEVRDSLVLTKIFTGRSCVEEFLEYITTRVFDHPSKDIFCNKNQTSLVLFSFNGAKYDHPLIVKHLMALNVEIMGGGMNDPRSMIVKRSTCFLKGSSPNSYIERRQLIFSDFRCLLPVGTLLQTCRALLPSNCPLVKDDKFDIKSKPISWFETNLDSVIMYCDMDVLCLAACILITLTNFNKMVIEILDANPKIRLNSPSQHSAEEKSNIAMTEKPYQFDLFSMISASQWAFNMFKTYFLKYETNPIPEDPSLKERYTLEGETSSFAHSVLKQMYTGGMTGVVTSEFNAESFKAMISEVLLPGTVKHMSIYDKNSSYPDAMSGPIPFYKFKAETTKCDINMLNVNDFVFKDHTAYHVTVCEMRTRYGNYTFNPQAIMPTPVKGTGKLSSKWGTIYPLKYENQWIWGYELRTYIETYKYCLEFPNFEAKFCFNQLQIDEYLEEDIPEEETKGSIDNKRLIFKKYIDFFYGKKSACKSNKDIAPLEVLFKLFLNSLYGKFGQKEYPDTSYMYDEFDEEMFSSDPSTVDVQKCGFQKEVLHPVYKVSCKKEYKSVGSLVRIASFITMRARMSLWSTMIHATAHFKNSVAPAYIYYFDTDSIFLCGSLPSNIVDDLRLGAWKLEDHRKDVMRQHPDLSAAQINNYQIDRAIFLAPKLYALIDQTHHSDLYGYLKAKGIRKDAFNMLRFMELSAQREIEVKQLQFRRAMGHVFVDNESSKTISLKVKKRKFGDDPELSSEPFYDVREYEIYLQGLNLK